MQCQSIHIVNSVAESGNSLVFHGIKNNKIKGDWGLDRNGKIKCKNIHCPFIKQGH